MKLRTIAVFSYAGNTATLLWADDESVSEVHILPRGETAPEVLPFDDVRPARDAFEGAVNAFLYYTSATDVEMFSVSLTFSGGQDDHAHPH